MKILSATATAIAAATLFCALSTGGQQKNQGTPAASSKRKAPAKQQAAQQSESGCKMGGQWEPGCYEKIVGTTATVKAKAEYLARVADALQVQINNLEALRSAHANYTEPEITRMLARIAALEKHANELTDVTNMNAAAVSNNVAFLMVEVDDLKRQLNNFKDAACPVLRTARVGWDTRMKLDSACGLH